MPLLPTIAIIGRPNVGKSTLFNRLVGEARAVVNDEAGTTRDRIDATVEWRGKAVRLIDTAGIEGEKVESLEDDVRQQIAFAQAEADLILFVVDARDEVMQQDRIVAKTLYSSNVPVILVVNKADTHELRVNSGFTFASLGLGEGHTMSAASGSGTGDLLDLALDKVEDAPPSKTADQKSIRFALFGRPNVGKSTLLNALLGEERAIVSDVPGTTRDRIDARIDHKDLGSFTVVDTAGIKRKRSIKRETLDDWVTQQSLKTLKTCDVALLLIDANDFITAQDRKLATLAYSYGKGLIIVVNKWDIIRQDAQNEQEDMEIVTKDVERELGQLLPTLRTTPAVLMSAKDGRGIDKVLPAVNRVYNNRIRRLSREEMEVARKIALKRIPVPNNEKGKKMRVGTFQQSPDVPPHFTISSGNSRDKLPRAYLQRLTKILRTLHDFEGIPIRVDQRLIPDKVNS